jgi:hypothetical protein
VPLGGRCAKKKRGPRGNEVGGLFAFDHDQRSAVLQPSAKGLISDQLLPETKEHFDDFSVPRADTFTGKGSHYQRMRGLIEILVGLI